MKIGTYTLSPKKSCLMGIVNVTPDSFSDGGKFFDTKEAVRHTLRLAEEGADIIDVGGESTRPGSSPISQEEELRRVIPVIEGVRKISPVPLSIDTTKATVARLALEAGADMVNDVSAGGMDADLLNEVARKRVPLCLMHMRGTPRTMQQDVVYDDLMGEIRTFLADALTRAIGAGVMRSQLIVDPGIGFGKSAEDTIVILTRLSELSSLDVPLLVGTSRKSFIGKLLDHPLEDRLEASLATLSCARRQGASIFRVHDVAPARRYLDMVDLLGGR